jgi:hypothetical protein
MQTKTYYIHSHFMISHKNVLKGPKEWGGGGGAILHEWGANRKAWGSKWHMLKYALQRNAI